MEILVQKGITKLSLEVQEDYYVLLINNIPSGKLEKHFFM